MTLRWKCPVTDNIFCGSHEPMTYGAGSLYSTIKKWHLNIFRHLKKSRYRKNKPVTLFSKTCSIELPASFLIYTLLKKLLAFKIALFLYDRPIFETHKITCTFWLVWNFHYFGQHYDFFYIGPNYYLLICLIFKKFPFISMLVFWLLHNTIDFIG